MSAKFECINISSKQPETLAKYYETIGISVYCPFGCYDGFRIGKEDEGYVCVWDENKWGKSTAGYTTLVFKVDNLQKTYESLIANGISVLPPKTTAWGGQELLLEDPDGNKIILL